MKQVVAHFIGTTVTFNKKAEIDPDDKCGLIDWPVLWPCVVLSACVKNLMFVSQSSKVSKV